MVLRDFSYFIVKDDIFIFLHIKENLSAQGKSECGYHLLNFSKFINSPLYDFKYTERN